MTAAAKYLIHYGTLVANLTISREMLASFGEHRAVRALAEKHTPLFARATRVEKWCGGAWREVKWPVPIRLAVSAAYTADPRATLECWP